MPLNTNWGPGPVNTNWGPGPGAKQKREGREIQILVLKNVEKFLKGSSVKEVLSILN